MTFGCPFASLPITLTRSVGNTARLPGRAASAVAAVAAALTLERRYDISPASLAFGLRVLAEPGVRAAVADLGRRLGRVPAPPGRAPAPPGPARQADAKSPLKEVALMCWRQLLFFAAGF